MLRRFERPVTLRFVPPPPLPMSPLSIAIAEHFGVLPYVVPQTRARRLTDRPTSSPPPKHALAESDESAPPPAPLAPPASGELMLLAGASGSGKSSLLRAIRRHAALVDTQVIDLRRIPLPSVPVVDLFDLPPGEAVEAGCQPFAPILRRLSHVGLAEVWTWLRPPEHLSEGQRWRLRLALAMAAIDRDADRPALILCDEFAALLDRVTAQGVASVLRRFVDERRHRVAAVVATSHDDLMEPLAPDVLVECDFGQLTVARATHRQRQKRLQRSGFDPNDLPTPASPATHEEETIR